MGGCASSPAAKYEQHQQQDARGGAGVAAAAASAPGASSKAASMAAPLPARGSPGASGRLPRQAAEAALKSSDTVGIDGAAAGRDSSGSPSAVSGAASSTSQNTRSLGELLQASCNEEHEVLLKVSVLMQRISEEQPEDSTPRDAIKTALDVIVADAEADFGCVYALPGSDGPPVALLLAAVQAPSNYKSKHSLLHLEAGRATGNSSIAQVHAQCKPLSWASDTKLAAPSNWDNLRNALGLRAIYAVPITSGQQQAIGCIELGFRKESEARKASTWLSYMRLVSTHLMTLRHPTIRTYQALAAEVYNAPTLDSMVHALLSKLRTLLGHESRDAMWYKFAIPSANGAMATIFDDTSVVHASQLSATGQARSALTPMARTVAATKSMLLSIVIRKNQQVLVLDVQKLMNKMGCMLTDLFNTRLTKSPYCAFIYPLKLDMETIGAFYLLSSAPSRFSGCSAQLYNLVAALSPQIKHAITHQLAQEFRDVRAAAAVSKSGQSFSNMTSKSDVFSGIGSAADSLGSASQGNVSTAALVTGITERLNTRRVQSSMEVGQVSELEGLQLTHMLGEGGFAKVFQGSWQGLSVGVKVVVDDGNNDKAVLRNAHEIAILGALSHPHIIQAYKCQTDVVVGDLVGQCVKPKAAHPALFSSTAFKHMLDNQESLCHVQIIDLCDLGNMSTALKYNLFQIPNGAKVLASVAQANREGRAYDGWKPEPMGFVYMQRLVLTLAEMASAMVCLHNTFGIIHCDLKPGNVLLKSSSSDPRGFTVKISDFGLSRIEDANENFCFNSCGTAPYVAPEGLINSRKVDQSVDVYAFGIMLWQMFTGSTPYGKLDMATIVEQVVMNGLRPVFPPETPREYADLARACWATQPSSRPTFTQVLSSLNAMLNTMDKLTVVPYFNVDAKQGGQ